jgi:hypothetical protein
MHIDVEVVVTILTVLDHYRPYCNLSEGNNNALVQLHQQCTYCNLL